MAVGRILITSTVVNGALLGAALGLSYYKYRVGQIDGIELKQTIAQRSLAATGSISGSTIGAIVGTLLLSRTETFVGVVIGGMVGDYLGSRVGETLFKAHARPHKALQSMYIVRYYSIAVL